MTRYLVAAGILGAITEGILYLAIVLAVTHG